MVAGPGLSNHGRHPGVPFPFSLFRSKRHGRSRPQQSVDQADKQMGLADIPLAQGAALATRAKSCGGLAQCLDFSLFRLRLGCWVGNACLSIFPVIPMIARCTGAWVGPGPGWAELEVRDRACRKRLLPANQRTERTQTRRTEPPSFHARGKLRTRG